MIYSAVEGRFVQDALNDGHRLGIFASGDGHVGHPGRWSPANRQGLIAFQADSLTRDSIWQSMINRRVYGTSGARILLQFRVNDSPMGSEIDDSDMDRDRRCLIHAMGAAPIEQIELIKNGEILMRQWCDGLVESFGYTDSSAPHYGDYYYARVTQADGHQAWSSPVWLGQERH